MISWKRFAAAAAIVLAPLGSAGVTVGLTAAPAGAQPACTDFWQTALTGTTNWNTAGDWSTGIPTGTTVACIFAAGTYTVDLTGSANVEAIEVGDGNTGTQTLEVDGSATSVQLGLASGDTSEVGGNGVLTLAPNNTGGYAMITGGTDITVASGGTLTTTGPNSTAYLRTPITNQSGGTVTIGAATTAQGSDTLTSNAGTFTVSGGGGYTLSGGSSFTDSGGTLTVTGSMQQDAGTFTQSGGTESGNPVTVDGGATLADSAGTGAFDVNGSSSLSGTIPSGQTVNVDGSGTSVQLTVATGVTDDGTLDLSPGGGGYAMLTGGTLSVGSGANLATVPGSSSDAYLRTAITNDAGGTVTIGAPNTVQDSNTLTTSSGAFTVSSGGAYTLSGGSSFTHSAGALTLTGSMTQDAGTFTQSGGTESGNPVTVDGGATIADSAGAGAFDVTGSSYLSGTIPTGQTVNVSGAGTSVSLTVNAAVTVKGTLDFSPGAGGYAMLAGAGPVTVKSGANLATVPGSSSDAYLRTAITNDAGGTVTIGAPNTVQDSNTLTTNSGTFAVSSGGGYALTGGSSFKDLTGTLTVTGSMILDAGTFTQSGGTESGNPVTVEGGATIADSAGTGAFDVTGSSNLSGTIPSGQTVNVSGAGTSVALTVSAAVTVDGTLDLSPGGGGYAMLSGAGPLTVASGGNLSTVAGSSSAAYLRTPITNDAGGTVTIGAPNTQQDSDTITSNSGTVQVLNGGQLALSAGSTLVNSSTATVGVTVNGTDGDIAGAGVTDAGTLAVSTVGTPTTGTMFTPISGPSATGTFSAFDFETDSYTVTYPSGTVVLTAQQTYTLTPTSISPKEYHPTGSVQVAAISNANLGTGTYSATVNWGDGKPTQAATVATSGPSGTVTAPTHKYKSAGTFTLTVTVSNTVGAAVTSVTTTELITVTGPVITSVSPTSGPVGKKVTIDGSDLAGATVKFGGDHGATPSSDTATQIVVHVPSGSITGKIVIIVADGKGKTPIFTVT